MSADGAPTRPRAILRAALASLAALAVAAWVSFKLGIAVPPASIAALAASTLALIAAEATLNLAAAVHGPLRTLAAARAATLAGVLLAGGAGLINWARGIQGFVVLSEGGTVALGGELQELDAGPFADLTELDAAIRLERVDLVPASDGFLPESHLAVLRAGRPDAPLVVRPGRAGADGPLRLYQGAFGFAPRVVVAVGGRTVLDRAVPFTTRREGMGVAFEGAFEVADEGLAVRGAVSLDALDGQMRGHPRLAVEVRRGDAVLGAGELSPGHFAELDGGVRVGFVGVDRWSEVDVARRSERPLVFGGAALAAAGLVTWTAAAVLARRRR